MAENNKWNKKIFSMLLAEAKGVRSWRQFAIDCDISYVQMRKLALGTQENPPRPKLIRKVAENAFGDIELKDFMFAAGINVCDAKVIRESQTEPETNFEKYRSLSPKNRRTVNAFIEFLHSQKNED
jgi:hypothetical protein